jgi:diguanylate cyclase (GGDEF)-like protein/PAS domain S-box-containing protein
MEGNRSHVADSMNPKPGPILGGRAFLVALAACLLAAAGLGVWIAYEYLGATVTTRVDDGFSTAAPLLAALACGWTGFRQRGRGRVGWILLGLSCASWAAGSATRAYFGLVGQHVPFPSVSDVGFLAAVPLAIGGLAGFPTAAPRATSRLRTALDGMIIAAALLFLSWGTVLGPVFEMSSGSLGETVIGLAYPTGDLVMGAIVLFLLSRSRRELRLPLLLVGAGILSNTISDSTFTYLQLQDEFSAIANVVGVGWVLGFLLIALGALRETGFELKPESADTHIGAVSTVLPYFPLLPAASLAAGKEIFVGSLDLVLFWTALFIVGAVVIRQLVTMIENLTLNRTLEARVADRTAELRQSEERFRALVQKSSDVITIADGGGVITYQSPSASRVLGYPPDGLAGTPFLDSVHPDDRSRVKSLIDTVTQSPGASTSIEARLHHQDGDWRQCEMTVTNLLEEAAVRGLVMNTRDITDRKAIEEQLMHQAFHDALTGLANRALFRDRLRQSIARAQRRREQPAILYMDLDAFKSINDILGHPIGDALLTAVAKRIKSCVREGDTVARLGGDEFAILLEDTEELESPTGVAQRILEELNRPFHLDGRDVAIHASIGIASRTGVADADELLRDADIAMYRAKAGGKSRFEIFTDTMQKAVVSQLELEVDLQRAIEDGEFFIHYQPLVDLASGQTVAVEALARWRHPWRGVVPPAEFIPAAEKTGAIVSVGRWVLQRACEQVRAWQDANGGPALGLAVNLSARQLKDPGLVEDVIDAVASSGLEPTGILLEMTESVLMDDLEKTIPILQQLKALGLMLAVDDFGTGYSSLSYLRQLPVDTLKIDRSFISGLGKEREAALVETIVNMGRSLKLEVVAEGIEDDVQLAALKRMGCELGQGYLFAQPMPADQVATYLDRERAARTAA